jgi:putative ABC transport system permease protein
MSSWLQDLRYALRALRRAPGFTLTASLTLAVGIGATTLVWSVVDGVVLRPLPYDEPGRLVRVFETAPGRPDDTRSIAHPTLDAWADLRSFEAIALYGPWSLDLAGEGRPERLEGAAVSPGFFATFRARPALGRSFTQDEYRPGGPRVIVLSEGLWRRRFGADPVILGRTLRLGGDPFAVIGVMPRGFGYPGGAGFWVTTALDAEYDARRARHLSAIGRLSPGVDLAAARADLLRVESSLAAQYPEAYTGFGIRVEALHERIVGPVRRPLLLVLAAVGAVLLVACANVANLTLARSAGRERELAVRVAIGASAGRAARFVLLENVCLALLGGAAGVLAAGLSLDVLRALLADRLPRMAEVSLDPRILGFATAVTLLTGLIVALAPVRQVLRRDVYGHLRQGSRGQSPSRRQVKVRGWLLVAQTAIALVLLTSSGLLVRSFAKLMAVDAGVRTEGVLTFHVSVPPARESDRAHVVDFYRRLREQLQAIPGVENAAFASRLPLSGADHSNAFHLVGETPVPGSQRSAQDRAVSPGYFGTLGIPIRGREFTDADTPEAPPVAIVNQAFARRYFPERDGLGEWIVPSRAGGVPRQIVGLAGDARQFGLDAPAEPEFYLPHAQDPWPWLSAVVHTAGDPLALARAAEAAVWSLDPGIPVTQVRPMDALRAELGAPRRLALALMGLFAGLALVLAAIGTYGVTAYGVTERLPEIGIRVALGATAAGVRRLVVRRALAHSAIGIGVGLAAAAAAGRLLETLLFGVGAWDLPTLLSATTVLAGTALLASYLPARRATSVDPVRVLRSE